MERTKKRAKRYCAVFNCLHDDRDPNLIFFKLPTDTERCKKWLSAIDREELLSKKIFKPHSYYVCSSHFEKSSITIVPRLNEGAIPKLLLPNQSQQGTSHTKGGKATDDYTKPSPNVDEKARTMSVATQTESLQLLNKVLGAKTPLKRRIKTELINTNAKCRRLDFKIKNIERKSKEEDVSKRIIQFIEWHNKLKNKSQGNLFTAEYKRFTLNLHYSSPKTYRCLETILNLPSKSTLRKLKFSIPPKLDNRILESLGLKVRSLPDEAKYCTICIDEMTLKQNLYYDIKSDEIIGFHNINGNVTPDIASFAYVIMLKGLYYEWQQPLAYALASAKHYEEIDVWLEEVISKLSEIGIDTRAIITVQGSNFDIFAKEVKGVSVENPFFMYNDKKIFYILDVPDLIKCIRNNLLTSDFCYDGKIISWDYIRQLYDSQKANNLGLIPKITESHIEPNNSNKMRVKYAVQIFSHTLSAALHTYINLDKIPEEARSTADFLESMNNLFDVLNSSRVQCKNKIKTAFKLTDVQEKVLVEAQNMFMKIKSIKKETGKNNTKHIKCFVDFQISIQAIKMLYNDLKESGFQYLLTRRLNDSLENFFGSIRQQLGSCTEPTPIQFRRAFSKLFFCNMLKNSPDPNCELDICQIFLKAEEVMILSEKSDVSPSRSCAVFLNGETDYRVGLPQENALTYVSSYLLFKCMKKHKCLDFNEVLRYASNLEETNLFPRLKAFNKKSSFYGSLKMPSEELIDYIQSLEASFTHNFVNLIQTNPGKQLFELSKTIPPRIPCSCFPVEYLLKLFVRLRIYTTLKLNNRHFRDSKNEDIKYLKVRHL